MNLQERYGNGNGDTPKDLIVSNYVSSCNSYAACSFENALDMATGNYKFLALEKDELSKAGEAFFEALSYDDKINFACNQWPVKSAPGETYVYHTSDHFLLGAAMNSYFKTKEGQTADFFDNLLVDDIFTPLGKFRIHPSWL